MCAIDWKNPIKSNGVYLYCNTGPFYNGLKRLLSADEFERSWGRQWSLDYSGLTWQEDIGHGYGRMNFSRPPQAFLLVLVQGTIYNRHFDSWKGIKFTDPNAYYKMVVPLYSRELDPIIYKSREYIQGQTEP